jgi:hypothetical protein
VRGTRVKQDFNGDPFAIATRSKNGSSADPRYSNLTEVFSDRKVGSVYMHLATGILKAHELCSIFALTAGLWDACPQ